VNLATRFRVFFCSTGSRYGRNVVAVLVNWRWCEPLDWAVQLLAELQHLWYCDTCVASCKYAI